MKRFFNRTRIWLSTASGNNINLDKFENDTHEKVVLFKFNKIVSGFMEFYNANKNTIPDIESAAKIGTMLKIFAPGFSSQIQLT